jgi:ubiquinone/menaquinone biosynthesis C-methylase UbiE
MTDDHFTNIYHRHADTYQEMISYEDVDGRLPRTLEQIASFHGKMVLDLGSGTGRIPQLFPKANITCLDLHFPMLQESQRQRDLISGSWTLLQGDGRLLPFPAACFEVVTAGWAFGHFTGWYPADWPEQIEQVLQQAYRVARPGAAVIILETLTTGALEPSPPTPSLSAYYRYLEEKHGFQRETIQTDFLFEDLPQACRYAGFFFGKDLEEKVRLNNWIRLPEWTGVWHKML